MTRYANNQGQNGSQGPNTGQRLSTQERIRREREQQQRGQGQQLQSQQQQAPRNGSRPAGYPSEGKARASQSSTLNGAAQGSRAGASRRNNSDAANVQVSMQQRGGEIGAVMPVSTGEYSRSNQGKYSKNKGGGKRGGWNVVFYVSIVVAVVALISLAVIIGMYIMGRANNDSIADKAGAPSDYESVSLADLTVDWEALRAVNPDIVAWVYMPDTVINYPVVQTENNEKYLYYDFEGNRGTIVNFGTIFVDYNNSENFTDRNNFIYGHNMNDGSMFAQIAELADTNAFNSHRTIYLLTPNGNFRLTSFACVHVAATSPIVQTKFADDAAYTAYIQDKIDNSVVTPDPAIPAASEIKKSFAFSTCDDSITSGGRIILFCYVAESTSDYAGGLDSSASQQSGATTGTANSISSAANTAANN